MGKVYTRDELEKAICYWADHIATISLNPNTPEACAAYVWEEHGHPVYVDTEEES